MDDQQILALNEIMQRDDEIAALNQKLYQLARENTSMRKTIDTVLRVKCKRGEGAFALNTELKACVERNMHAAVQHGFESVSARMKVPDLAVHVLLHTLVGVEGNDIPCAVLHSPQYTIVYKEDDMWIVCTLNEFTDIFYRYVQPIIMSYSGEYIAAHDSSITDTQIGLFNALLSAQQFASSVKTMVKMYKDY